MFCHKCGREVDNDARYCSYCGADLRYNSADSQPTNETGVATGVSKVWVGVLLGLFLGLIGLLIGFAMYPSGSFERQTFVRGWGIAFAVLFGLIFLSGFASMI